MAVDSHVCAHRCRRGSASSAFVHSFHVFSTMGTSEGSCSEDGLRMSILWQPSAFTCLPSTSTHAHSLELCPIAFTKTSTQHHTHDTHRMRIMVRLIAAIGDTETCNTPSCEESIRLALA